MSELGEVVIDMLTEKIDNAKEILHEMSLFPLVRGDMKGYLERLQDTLCSHDDIKYQSAEPENNISQGAWCRECNKEVEYEYDHEKYDVRFA